MENVLILQPKNYTSTEKLEYWRRKFKSQAEEGVVMVPTFFNVIQPAKGLEQVEVRPWGGADE